MPRIVSFLFFLLFIYTFNAKAENIKGILLSQKDSISIPYAHIGVKGTGIGTVSNINGEFELKYHFNSKSDTIVISHIEYEKKYIPLHLLLTDTINHITLKKYKHLLGDVIILPEKRKKSIIDSVILNLKNNYADKLYQCEAFYREVKYEEKSKQYSRLIEAAINIQDKKINSSLSKIKCSILEFRKSNNYTKEHWGSKFIKKLIDYPDNKLQILLERNPIRSYFTNKQLNKFNPLKHIKENKTNSLSLEKVIQNNKQDIYIFTYLHSTLYTYTIYINKPLWTTSP